MPQSILLPNLGENIDNAKVTRILVKVDEAVVANQGIIEVETGKATFEVPVKTRGMIKQIHVQEGETIAIGAKIVTLDDDATKSDLIASTKTDDKIANPTGDTIKSTSASISNTTAGLQEAIPKSPPSPAHHPSEFNVNDITHHPKNSRDVPAAPGTRRFAREIGIQINRVHGTGSEGRISIPDVKAYSRQLNQTRLAKEDSSLIPKPLPDFSVWGSTETEPLSQLRRAAADHLTHAWQSIPHVTQHDHADITQLESLRTNASSQLSAAGIKLTISAFLIKVICNTLKKFPRFNASYDSHNHALILKHYYHIGVAVDTPHGLVVPTLCDSEQKSVTEIARELAQISDKARQKKLMPNDMTGGTFTLSNLGGIGGTSFTPIINWPEVAILGVARGKWTPTWDDDKVVPKLLLPLSLSYDHRVIDGADGARFLRSIVIALENPFMMLL